MIISLLLVPLAFPHLALKKRGFVPDVNLYHRLSHAQGRYFSLALIVQPLMAFTLFHPVCLAPARYFACLSLCVVHPFPPAGSNACVHATPYVSCRKPEIALLAILSDLLCSHLCCDMTAHFPGLPLVPFFHLGPLWHNRT